MIHRKEILIFIFSSQEMTLPKDLCWMLRFINQMHPRIDRREWLLKSFQISWYRLWPHQSFTIPCVKKDIHQWTTTQCGTHVQNRTLTTWDIFHHHTDIPKTPPHPCCQRLSRVLIYTKYHILASQDHDCFTFLYLKHIYSPICLSVWLFLICFLNPVLLLKRKKYHLRWG